MKIQVTIKNLNKAAATSTSINATVGPTDTVLNVQELVASMTNTFSFPDQKLVFKGNVLQNKQRLSEAGVKDGDGLEFVFQASEATLIKQLSELIGTKSVSHMELGMLYSYRHAVSFEDAFKALGYGKDVNLRCFLESQKCFSLQGDCVKVVQAADSTVQTSAPLSSINEDKANGIIEVEISVEVRVDGRSPELLSCDEDDDIYMRFDASETVARAKELIAASQQMPFPSRELMLGDQLLEDELTLGDAMVKNGSVLLMVVHASEKSLASQLEKVLSERKALSTSELGLHYCQRFGTPVGQALRTLGLHANLGRFLEAQSQFSIAGGCVTLANGPRTGSD